MTKMAVMPIYGKNRLKSFSPGPDLKLCMQHGELKHYKVYIKDAHGVILTYFTARSNWVAYTFEWGKLLQSHLMGENLHKRTLSTE